MPRNTVFSSAVKAFALFIILELVIILVCLVVLGAYSQPLEFITHLCESIGSTPTALAVAIFVVSTIFNVVLMAVVSISIGRR